MQEPRQTTPPTNGSDTSRPRARHPSWLSVRRNEAPARPRSSGARNPCRLASRSRSRSLGDDNGARSVLTNAAWDTSEHSPIHSLVADHQQIDIMLGGECTDHFRRFARAGKCLGLQAALASLVPGPAEDGVDLSSRV